MERNGNVETLRGDAGDLQHLPCNTAPPCASAALGLPDRHARTEVPCESIPESLPVHPMLHRSGMDRLEVVADTSFQALLDQVGTTHRNELVKLHDELARLQYEMHTMNRWSDKSMKSLVPEKTNTSFIVEHTNTSFILEHTDEISTGVELDKSHTGMEVREKIMLPDLQAQELPDCAWEVIRGGNRARQSSITHRETEVRSTRSSALGTQLSYRTEDDGEEDRSKLLDVVELLTFGAIFLNGLMIGFQTDHMARHTTLETPILFFISEIVFCIVFSMELTFRLSQQRLNFFTDPEGRLCNLFDALVVSLQIVEIVCSAWKYRALVENVSFLRLLRTLRLLRVLRVVRLLAFFGELNVVTSAIMNSLKSLMGTAALLMLMMYVVAIFFTQVVVAHLIDLTDPEDGVVTQLNYWWGSVARSMLSLCEAVMAGADWDSPLAALEQCGYLNCVLFLCYITFSLLAMMNVITGIFVESALKNAEHSKDRAFIDHVRHIFSSMLEPGQRGKQIITRKTYMAEMDSPSLQRYMLDIGIDPDEAKILFGFIDSNGSDTIDSEELLSSLIRLRAGAKFMDVMTIMHEMNLQHQRWNAWSKSVDEHLFKIHDSVGNQRMLP